MNKRISIPIVGAMLLLSGSAFAGQLKGTITGITRETHQVQLDDGSIYRAKATVDLSVVHTGDHVTLTTITEDTKPVITKIEKTTP